MTSVRCSLLAACALVVAACAAPADARRAQRAATVVPCDTAALDARGDLDGVLDALDRCADGSLEAHVRRAEVLVVLGDLADAKAALAAVPLAAMDAPMRARVDAVLAIPEAPPRLSDAVIDEAHALVAKARTEREPQKWIDLAKAKHALMRATASPATPCLLERQPEGTWAADHPMWRVNVHPVPVTVDGGYDADAITELDPQTQTLRAIRLLTPSTDLRAQPIVALPKLGPSAFALQTTDGIRVLFGPSPQTIPRQGSFTATPRGDALVVSDDVGVAVIEVGTWVTRWEQPVAMLAPRVTDDAVITLGGDLDAPTVALDLATGKERARGVGVGAVSPSGKWLAVLALDPSATAARLVWNLAVHDLASGSAARTIRLPNSAHTIPFVVFADEEMIRVTQGAMAHGCVVDSIVDVSATTGKVSSPWGAGSPCSSILDAPSTPGGLSATFHADVSPPQLLVARGGKALQLTSLTVEGGFTVTGVFVAPDERFAAACGYGMKVTGAFVVDVATGRTTFVDGMDCHELSIVGSRLFTPAGLVDLTGDAARIAPPFVEPDAMKELVGRSNLPTSTAGLYCRFGELLEPYEVCGPPDRP